jgi:hypothetical protein
VGRAGGGGDAPAAARGVTRGDGWAGVCVSPCGAWSSREWCRGEGRRPHPRSLWLGAATPGSAGWGHRNSSDRC